MKFYTKGVMALLTIILSAFSVNAQSVKGEPITDKGYAYVLDPANAAVELKPGLTCGEWSQTIRRFARLKFSEDPDKVLADSKVEYPAKSKYILYNTHWKNGRVESFGPDTIDSPVLVYRDQIWLVRLCGQPVSTDPGFINRAMNERDQEPFRNQSLNNQQTNQNLTVDSMNRVDVYHHLENGPRDASQVSNTCGFPWEWVIGLLIVGLIIYFAIRASNAARTAAMEEARISDKKAIKRFLKMKRNANSDDATNFVEVGKTLKTFNTP